MAKQQVAGLLLAAGAGTRFGRPKALVELGGETLAERAVRTLRDGGCAPVIVVLGAEQERVRGRLPAEVHPVYAADWPEGMGASLRAGLAATPGTADAVLVHLVDLPGVDDRTVAALAARAHPTVVARAAYRGRPGHPVLFGTEHITDIGASLHGDAGARGWLAGRGDIEHVECGEFGDDADVDTPEALRHGLEHGRWG